MRTRHALHSAAAAQAEVEGEQPAVTPTHPACGRPSSGLCGPLPQPLGQRGTHASPPVTWGFF